MEIEQHLQNEGFTPCQTINPHSQKAYETQAHSHFVGHAHIHKGKHVFEEKRPIRPWDPDIGPKAVHFGWAVITRSDPICWRARLWTAQQFVPQTNWKLRFQLKFRHVLKTESTAWQVPNSWIGLPTHGSPVSLHNGWAYPTTQWSSNLSSFSRCASSREFCYPKCCNFAQWERHGNFCYEENWLTLTLAEACQNTRPPLLHHWRCCAAIVWEILKVPGIKKQLICEAQTNRRTKIVVVLSLWQLVCLRLLSATLPPESDLLWP